MRSFFSLMKRLNTDEKGAALIEYTVLLGVLLIAVIIIIFGVGQWISTEWAQLSSQL